MSSSNDVSVAVKGVGKNMKKSVGRKSKQHVWDWCI